MLKILQTCGKTKIFIQYENKILKKRDGSNIEYNIITGFGIDLCGERPKKIIIPRVTIPESIDDIPVRRIENYADKTIELPPIINGDIDRDIIEEDDIEIIIQIEELILPDTVDYISNYAFKGSKYVKKIVWPESCKIIPYECFYLSNVEEVVIPEGIEKISKGAFKKSKLRKINIPDSCKVLEYECFSDCRGLKNIDIPDTLESINNDVFRGSGIEKIIWPSHCKEIPSGCLANCPNLQEVIIKGNIEYIENDVLIGSTAIKTLNLSGISNFPKAEEDFFTAMKRIPNVIKPFYTDIILSDTAEINF